MKLSSDPKHREQHALLLYEASKMLGAPTHLKSSFDALLTGILHRYGLTVCLLLVEESGTELGLLKTEFSLGISGAFAQSFHIPKGQGSVGVAFASGMPRQVAFQNGAEDDALLHTLFQRQKLSAAFLFPLKAEGRVIGVALYGATDAKVFADEAVRELAELSDHIALALHNGKRMAALEESHRNLEAQTSATVQELERTNNRLVQKVRELKTVYELALATAASTKVEEIVGVMISGIKELLDVQGAAFFLFQGAPDTLEPVLPAFDLPPEAAQKLTCNTSESKCLHQVARTAEPQILNLMDSDPSLPAAWKEIGIRSLLVLPLLQGDILRGVFCVINKMNGLFNQDDVRMLALLTGRVMDVLHRIGLDQELHQRVNDLSVLQEMSAQLPSPPVLPDTVAAVGRVARKALAADVCFFFLYHAESEALVMQGGDWDSSFSFDARAFTLGVSEKVPLADVFRDGRPVEYHRGSAGDAWEKDELSQGLHLDQLLYLPLDVEQGRIGVMALGTRRGRTLSVEDRRLASLLSNRVAIVVERSRLYERLKSANEKLEQINHLKNEFISMVSHELRTPLTTIKGFVSIVLNEETGPLNDQQRHFLETSDRAIDRLTLLVSDLLDISRIEAGQIKMQLRPVNVRDICKRMAAAFDPQFMAQKLTLTMDIPDALPNVLADPDRIGQVLDNLISNSLKFTTQGGIHIRAIDKGDFVMLSVKDSGQGIPKGEQDKIFDKFYQIKVGGGYPAKGTGLGLAIVKSIIESHRGKVWVESDPGKGADFRFILPRARTETTEESGKEPKKGSKK